MYGGIHTGVLQSLYGCAGAGLEPGPALKQLLYRRVPPTMQLVMQWALYKELANPLEFHLYARVCMYIYVCMYRYGM